MRTPASVKKDSSIYGVIQGSLLSEHDRQLSLDALDRADAFAEGLLWTMHKIEDLSDHLLGKSTVKH